RSQDAIQGSDEVEQARVLTAGNVEDLACYAIRGGGKQIRVDDVRHIGKIARLGSVAVDEWSAAVAHCQDEFRNDRGVLRGGIFPGAEHIEIAQADSLETVKVRESATVMFAGQLGDCVGRKRYRRERLDLGQYGRIAVHRRRRGIDKAADSGAPASLK